MPIRKRESKNGVLYEVYFRYVSYDGVKHYYSKRGFKKVSDAKNHEAKMKSELQANGDIYKESNKTLKEIYDEFLSIGSSQYQYNTILNTKKVLKHWNGDNAVINLGRIPISKINYVILQDFFNRRSKEGKQINLEIRKVLNRILQYAIKCNYIQNNPLQYVQVLGINNQKEKHILSVTEYNLILEAITANNSFTHNAMAIAVKIGYYTGMRISEIYALEKEDILLNQNLIFVHRKLIYKGLKGNEIYAVNNMKTKSSKAYIPLPEKLKGELLTWFNMNPYSKVICDDVENYLNCNSSIGYFRKISKKLNIPFHFHLLRHTYASTLVNANVPPRIAMDLLRHSNYATTMNIYTHIADEQKKNIVNKIFK